MISPTENTNVDMVSMRLVHVKYYLLTTLQFKTDNIRNFIVKRY